MIISGCPNEGGIRALVWKILLGYLPLKRNFWERDLLQQRDAYREFVRDMIIRPGYKEKEELGEEDAPQIIDHVKIFDIMSCVECQVECTFNYSFCFLYLLMNFLAAQLQSKERVELLFQRQ